MVHVHAFHHPGKGDLDGLDAVLGSTGIVSKPGTILIYKRLVPKEIASPRVLTGWKHREGDPEDLPATVLDFDPVTKRLSVAGLEREMTVRDIGIGLITTVMQAGGAVTWVKVMETVTGRHETRLEALRLLTHPAHGVLVKTGTAKSRTHPRGLRLRSTLKGDPIAVWKAQCLAESRVNSR